MSERIQEPRYATDPDGYVGLPSCSYGELGRSMDAVLPYINGRERDGHPALGKGLRISGDPKFFPHDAAIHIDDLGEFTGRVRVFEQLRDGFVREEDEQVRPMTQDEIDVSLEKLTSFGLSRQEIIDVTTVSRRSTLNHQMLNLRFMLGRGQQDGAESL